VTAGYVIVGASHRTWTGAVRDALFAEPAEVPGLLARLRSAGLGQAVWLTTCDRVEVIAADADPAVVAGVLAGRAGVPAAGLAGQLRSLTGEAAIRHLFAVAASLDSQIVGEPEVLGQVKAAYRQAVAAGMVGSELDAAMRAAFAVAKRVRAETGLSEGPTSIAAAAVDIARDLHGDLGRRKGLLIGLGDMGQLMVQQLRAAGLGGLTVMTPVDARAEAAARRLGCHYAPFGTLDTVLAGSDIVVTAVGLGRYILGAEAMAAALRRRRQPVFMIDAALPADVEPSVGEMDIAFVYDLGDLERVALRGRVSREAAATAAWAMVDQAVAGFCRERAGRAATPAVTALRRHFEAVRRRVLAENGGCDAEEATRRLVNRLLHQPCEALRRLAAEAGGAGQAERAAAERLLRTLFAFDPATFDPATFDPVTGCEAGDGNRNKNRDRVGDRGSAEPSATGDNEP
jgi:glutamyl-tRNA reductase